MRSLLSALLLLGAAHLADAAALRPNIIVINVDDLGYGDIHPFGSEIPTPQIDRLAREGRLLTSHYAAVVCSPSRAALMTGCYPKRVLQIPLVLFPAAAVGLNPTERTVADLLRDAGYATACIGKWHLGDQPEFLPRRHGFDYYFGLPYSNDMGPEEDGTKTSLGKPPRAPRPGAPGPRPVPGELGIVGAQPPLALLENDRVVERIDQQGQLTLLRRYTDKAKSYLREHTGGPFFLYFAHNAVHFPYYPVAEFQSVPGHGELSDMVREVDQSVGELLDLLKELKLDRNTFILFTSDNGGSLPLGGRNLPLRGSKGETWEGGIRTPTIAWWPGQIPAGTRTAAITSMMDVLPTLAGLAGAKVPGDRKIDGVDLWPILTGEEDASPPRTFYFYKGLKLEAVRTGPWKLHLGKGLLFNLDEDIGEARDQAAAHPEIVEQLQKTARLMDGDLGLESIGPGCRPMGRVSHPQPLLPFAPK